MRAVRLPSWSLSALACAAMLILPALVWLFTPGPPRYPVASLHSASALAPDLSPPAPQPVRPARLVRPAGSASPAEVTGPVTGVVLDPDGRLAKGAVVACEDRDPTLTATTDEEGRFELPEGAAGCMAGARHPEFLGSDRVELVAGRSNTLQLNRGGGIEGDVVDELRAPLASFTVAVESYQGPVKEGAPVGQLKTIQDPHGAFTWEKLPPGRYVLTASTEGRPPARSSPVEVEMGRVTAHVRIVVPRGATLSGRVLDASTRKPVAGAVIALDAFTVARQGTQPTRSDAQGAYALEGAPPGPFSVRVSHDGYRTRTVTGLTTRGSAGAQQDIELNPLVDGGPGGEDFAGIGAFLAPAANGVTFVRLVSAGPAEQAGILPGDLIQRIDGADASSMAVFECMQSLRGPEGSRVTVQVERAGKRLDVTIQRRAITL